MGYISALETGRQDSINSMSIYRMQVYRLSRGGATLGANMCAHYILSSKRQPRKPGISFITKHTEKSTELFAWKWILKQEPRPSDITLTRVKLDFKALSALSSRKLCPTSFNKTRLPLLWWKKKQKLVTAFQIVYHFTVYYNRVKNLQNIPVYFI